MGSHPQPRAALGSDGITPGSLQHTRVPVASVTEDLLSWWAPSLHLLCPLCHFPLSLIQHCSTPAPWFIWGCLGTLVHPHT